MIIIIKIIIIIIIVIIIERHVNCRRSTELSIAEEMSTDYTLREAKAVED